MGVIWSVLVSHFPFFVSQLSPVLFRLFLTWRRSPFALCQNFQPYTVEAPKAPRTTKWFLVCSYYQCWVENQLQLEKLHLPKWMPETSLTLTFCYCTPKKYIVPAFSDGTGSSGFAFFLTTNSGLRISKYPEILWGSIILQAPQFDCKSSGGTKLPEMRLSVRLPYLLHWNWGLFKVWLWP